MKTLSINCTLFSRISKPLIFLAFFLFYSMSWAQEVDNTFRSRVVSLDLNQFASQLSAAPMERSSNARSAPFLMELPMPDGTERTFSIVESPILDPEFEARFPTFKTYMVQDVQNPAISGRISVTPYGYNGVILTPEGMIHARPLDINNPLLHQISMAESGSDVIDCQVLSNISAAPQFDEVISQAISNGLNKRTYRLAIVVTGEFHAANGGSIPAASAVVTASVNGIQAIFERELSVGFQLLLPFIYTDASTDPFTVGGDRTTMAASAVGVNFNVNSYDVGHVFHDVNQGPDNLGGGGVANLGVVCSNTAQGTGFRKAGGWSGSFDNVSSGWINLATHEFGHMFNMDHTFNGTGSLCIGAISSSAAYEIGSGNTIMSYSGNCQANNNVPASGIADHYFHAKSLESAINFINGQTCEMATPTANTPPTVDANPFGGAHTIPKGTPFRLTGSGFDANGDLIFYTWEQYDEDGDGTPTQGFIGATAAASAIAPLFRSYPPSTNPTRYFPNQNLIAANNYASSFEPLPTVARTLNFRLTARDWKAGGGGVDNSDLEITVSNSGPLTVTAPNGAETLMSGDPVNVTWANNGSNAFCNLVNIRLSTDGGLNFPYILSTGTANDGSEMVTIPAGVINTTSARIMVESACNSFVVFFDISNSNFNITSTCLAGISNVCPATPLNLPAGNPGLNLALNKFFGGNVTQFAYNLTGTSPTGNMANSTVQNGNVCNNAGNFRHSVSNFTVSATGKYNFSLNPNDMGFRMFSLFLGNFDPVTPCTNFISSNSWANWFVQEGTTADLIACTEYSLVTWSLNENMTGSILVNGEGEVYATGGGPVGSYSYTYAAVNTANNQVVATSPTSDFTALTGGIYQIYGVSYYTGGMPPNAANPATWIGQTVSAILTGGTCVLFSNNFKPVTVVGVCTPPVVNAPTITQPTCIAPLGSLTVNATGAGPYEYSINNGANFQPTIVFNGLAAGNYNIIVREQANANCSTLYAGNPVTLNAATGCDNCAMVVSADIPKNIVDNTTVTSIINFPTPGTITDVNIKNLAGNHTFVGDLTFTLVSPQNTSVILIDNLCGSVDNFNISLDDQAAVVLSCPISDGINKQPLNPLSAFNGQNPMGNWTLQVNDNATQDQGTLNGWTLEICGNFNCSPTINSVVLVQPTCENQGGTITVNATGNSTLEYSINGNTFQASNIFTNVPPGVYGVSVRLTGNQACGATYMNNPVTIVAPVDCAQCLTFLAPGLPQAITDNATISSIINFNRSGTITDVKVKNLMGTHTYVSDLTFTLTSPLGTSVVLLANQCTSADNFNITLDDASAITLACPINDGSTKKPQNPLSAFDGQNPFGNWTLQVNDNAAADEGALTGWTLEVCGNFVNASCPPILDINYTYFVSSGTYQAETQITCVGTIPNGSAVTLNAGNNIELKPNFTLETGATLEMMIGGCSN